MFRGKTEVCSRAERHALEAGEDDRAIAFAERLQRESEKSQQTAIRFCRANRSLLYDWRLQNPEKFYQKALYLRHALEEENPTSKNLIALAFFCDKAGDLFLRTGELDAAERYYKKAIRFSTDAAKEHPDTDFQRILGYRIQSLGDIFFRIRSLMRQKDAAKKIFTYFKPS